MSVADVLLDTNVLVYSRDTSEVHKGPKAHSLLATLFAAGQPVIGVQAPSEFYWTITRKIRNPLSDDDASAETRRLAVLAKVAPTTWELVEMALDLTKRHQLALWDAQILASAKLNGCTRVLSEDFQHRGVVEGVTILNPFAADFSDAEAL